MKCFSVAIYKKNSSDRYYSGVLFVMVYKTVLTLQSVDKTYIVTIHIKTPEQFSLLVLLYVAKDVFNFDSVYELKNATTQRQTLREDLTRCYKLC